MSMGSQLSQRVTARLIVVVLSVLPFESNAQLSGSRTGFGVGRIFSPITDHGADRTGVNDAASALSASVADCNAAGGGIIDVAHGTYKLAGAVTAVTASGCRFYFHNVILAPSGTESFTAISFAGTGLGAALTLTGDAFQDTKSFQTTTNTGLSAGGFVYFERRAPDNGGSTSLYRFIAQIVSITGAGPYTVTINNSFPVAFVVGSVVKPWIPLENVGIDGNLVIDATGHSTGSIFGVVANNVAFSGFRHIRGLNTNPGLTFDTNNGGASGGGGYANTFDDITADNGSDMSNAAIWFQGETLPKISNIAARGGVRSGFGAQIQASSYPVVANMTSTGNSQVPGQGRNIKIQSTVNGNFTNLIGNAGGDTGIAIAVGSTRNNFFGMISNDNATSEGVWLSDQYNTDNRFFGITAHRNGTRDLFIGATDTNNYFDGVDAGIIANNGNAAIILQSGPSVGSKVVNSSYDLTTRSGIQVITGFGFKPSACEIYTRASVTGSTSQGFSDGALGQGVLFSTGTRASDLSAGNIAVSADSRHVNYQIGTLISYGNGSITIAWEKAGNPIGTLTEIVRCLQ